MMNELISIVVISYNSAKTIVETLNSIKNQTYPNIEIIVSDDCSTDHTVEMVEDWMKSNQNIKLVTSNVNTGIPGNVNRGIKASSGTAVKLIAADDMLMPNAVEVYYKNYLVNDSKTINVARVELFGDVTQKHIDYCENCYVFASQRNQYEQLLITNCLLAPSVGLLDKKMIIENGMFNENYPAFEDYPFYLKLSKKGYYFKLIDTPLVRYRVSDNSVGNGMSKRYLKSLSKFFFQEKLKMLLEMKMYLPAVRQSLGYGKLFIKSIFVA